MTPWVLCCLSLLVLILFLITCWWGSNIVFHPPNMIPNTVWPAQFGLSQQNVSFQTEDSLTLKGWLIPAAAPTERTLLLCHGWGDNKGDVLRRVPNLSRSFNLFLFDSRAHGESQGTFSTIGYLEAKDFASALQYLKTHKPNWYSRLGVFGISMGAAMAVYGAAQHPEIRCVALESPFQSFNRVLGQFGWNAYRFPYFPFAWGTLAVIRRRLGADPEPYSPIHHIAQLNSRPKLFIAAEKDALMPLEEVKALHAAAGEPKELWIVPGAAHGKCQEIAGAEYERRLEAFFQANL